MSVIILIIIIIWLVSWLVDLVRKCINLKMISLYKGLVGKRITRRKTPTSQVSQTYQYNHHRRTHSLRQGFQENTTQINFQT